MPGIEVIQCTENMKQWHKLVAYVINKIGRKKKRECCKNGQKFPAKYKCCF